MKYYSTIFEICTIYLIVIFTSCFHPMVAVAVSPANHVAVANKEIDNDFVRFIGKLKLLALQNGITEECFNLAFANITSPYPNVIRAVKRQPEFHQDPMAYINARLTQTRIDEGKKQSAILRDSLDLIEQRFGVDRNIILSIWANETDYGASLKNPKAMKDAFRALASLAYYKSHYNNYAKKQLLCLLKILQKNYISRENLKSSWAGAIGQTQFIPSSFLLYAVDLDGKGSSDIINNIPDALATTANLLNKNGWKKNSAWLFELDNNSVSKIKNLKGASKTLAQWSKYGVKLHNQAKLPQTSERATLLIIRGKKPLYLLCLKNFFTIKAYNKSNLYALSVALLANAIKN